MGGQALVRRVAAGRSPAARLLTRKLEADTSADVELQPFAVDTSSGAWAIAVHGVLLVLGTVVAPAVSLAAAGRRRSSQQGSAVGPAKSPSIWRATSTSRLGA